MEKSMATANESSTKSASRSEFLQSAEWRNFQQAFGRRTFFVDNADVSASVIEHELPIVGKYLYTPRGPIVADHPSISPSTASLAITELLRLAQKENAGWVRIEPENQDTLEMIRNAGEAYGNTSKYGGNSLKIVKAPYDVQPKEIFVIDISKSEEELLAEMKSKTRYNINLARKKGVHIISVSGGNSELISESRAGVEMLERDSHAVSRGVQHDNSYYVDVFLKLTKEMAARQGIVPHPDGYYRKMFETFPEDMLKLYCAQYEDTVVAANLMLFYGDTATYLHGASSNAHRNVMAPFLLQWQAIVDAKKMGCAWYDFGGVKTVETRNKKQETNTWEGITAFKLGFSPKTAPVVFPGTYDMIVNPRQYALYKGLQRAKMILRRIRK